MAPSGHVATALRTTSSRPAGTSGDATKECPSSSRSRKMSGAAMWHSVWPWQTSGSMWTRTAVTPLLPERAVVEDVLPPGDDLVKREPAPYTGGVRRREVLVPVDRADVLVPHDAVPHEPVVGQVGEHLDQHALERHTGEVRPDAAVHTEAERGVLVGEPVQDDLVGVLEDVGVVVGERVRHPHTVTLVE